jgi:hypothetical protein
MPCVELYPIVALQEKLLDCRKTPPDLDAARFGQRLSVENQRVLGEINDQRKTDRDRDGDLQDGGDQVLLYISPPLRTNSTDFSCIPFST